MLGQDEQPQRRRAASARRLRPRVEQAQADRVARIDQRRDTCVSIRPPRRRSTCSGSAPKSHFVRPSRCQGELPARRRRRGVFAQVLADGGQVAAFDDRLAAVIDDADFHLQVRRQPLQVEHLGRDPLAGGLARARRPPAAEAARRRSRSRRRFCGPLPARGQSSAAPPWAASESGPATLSATRPGTSQPSRSSESCASPSRGHRHRHAVLLRARLEVIDQRQLHPVESAARRETRPTASAAVLAAEQVCLGHEQHAAVLLARRPFATCRGSGHRRPPPAAGPRRSRRRSADRRAARGGAFWPPGPRSPRPAAGCAGRTRPWCRNRLRPGRAE